ncbi:MAG: two-component system response regulator [Caulobacter sp. 12-67-6]|nr:MAG: two-component system response regulator [Caulobacter sp. 12-67-6]
MKTCLVVDDSRVIRKVARRVLEDIGFEIAEAADGMEALAWCRAAMPDAVLLDWNMPVMNGIEFLRQLRNEPGGDTPTVVFCTVICMSTERIIVVDAVADAFAAKFAEAGLL